MRWTTFLLFLSSIQSFAASEWVLIRGTDGNQLEGTANLASLKHHSILSFHSGSPASEKELEQITSGLTAIQGKDRAARDAAVLELTAIGVPVVTPLLKALKDTDQHEPRPLYRLFERIMPSTADNFDRSLSILRLEGGRTIRMPVPEGSLELRKSDSTKVQVPWSTIRLLTVRKKVIKRTMAVHSLRHCTQIEYLDTGVVVAAASKCGFVADGFVRLSWNEDGWATDADGLKKPGSPAYKSNLFAGQPFGALVGRIGSDGEVFFIGKKASKSGMQAGRLQIAVNDNPHWQNNVGTYTVTLEATDAYDVGEPQ